jgi:hypothetical protein
MPWSREIINTPVKPTVAREWPLWAKAIKAVRSEQDSGVGDTVERIIGKENSDAYKKWHKSLFGKPCNCSKRKENWNNVYSYKS